MAEQPHVLVVDDDAKIAAALRRALIYEGYQVEVAPDGHIALARARDRMPDLAILDIMMPGIDGLEVTRRPRAAPPPGAPGSPHTPLCGRADGPRDSRGQARRPADNDHGEGVRPSSAFHAQPGPGPAARTAAGRGLGF